MTLQPWNRHGMLKVDLRSRLVSPPVDGKHILLLRDFVFSSAHYYVCTMKSEPLKRTLYLSCYHSELPVCAASSNTWNQKFKLSHDYEFIQLLFSQNSEKKVNNGTKDFIVFQINYTEFNALSNLKLDQPKLMQMSKSFFFSY